MAVPRSKHTKGRRNKRRIQLFLKLAFLAECSKCGKNVLPHRVCQYCGYYKDKEVIDVLKKLDKKEKKKREKEMKAKEAEAKEQGPLNLEELSKK